MKKMWGVREKNKLMIQDFWLKQTGGMVVSFT